MLWFDMAENDALIRKVIGRSKKPACVFERIEWLNRQLRELGIKAPPNDDQHVRRHIRRARPSSS
jgi:hypothetical protein